MCILFFVLILCVFSVRSSVSINPLPPCYIIYTSSRIFRSFRTPYRVCLVPAKSDSNGAHSAGAVAARRQNGVAVPQRAAARARRRAPRWWRSHPLAASAAPCRVYRSYGCHETQCPLWVHRYKSSRPFRYTGVGMGVIYRFSVRASLRENDVETPQALRYPPAFV